MRVKLTTVFEDVDELQVEHHLEQMKGAEPYKKVAERLFRGKRAVVERRGEKGAIVRTTVEVPPEKSAEVPLAQL